MTAPTAADVKSALRPRLRDFLRATIGRPENKRLPSHKVLRYGSKGSLTVILSGKYAGRWRDWETGEGGDVISLGHTHQ